MNSLPDEKDIATFAGVKLTTHRVRFDAKRMGAQEVKGIMLEQVASCSMAYKSYLILLVLAAISLASGFVEKNLLIGGIIGAIILVVLFLVTRKRHLIIGSAGDSISLLIVGQNPDKIREFIGQIEEAKNNRYLMLTGHLNRQ